MIYDATEINLERCSSANQYFFCHI